jgi:3-dehydroquinate synthase
MTVQSAASNQEVVRVDLGRRSYDIVIGANLIPQAGLHIRPFVGAAKAIVITDANVARLHLDPLTHSLDALGIRSERIVLEPGEGSKSFTSLAELCDRLLDLGVERKSALVALGGGVIGDLVGFAASILLRGIDFIQVPTTLLAQVDSSAGGKTGINTRQGKNLVGSFHQPRLVLSDTRALDTLPKRELLAGYAEVVKYGLIDDPDFFTWCEGHGAGLIGGDETARRRAIAHSCRAKAAIVADDEREAGRRALLNLGHTFAHALEAECEYGDELLHGEAVAIGMAMAFDLSARLGLASIDDAARVHSHLASVGLPTSPTQIDGREWSSQALIDHMRKDKKVIDGRIAFVLARGIGKAFTPAFADLDDVAAIIDESIAED